MRHKISTPLRNPHKQGNLKSSLRLRETRWTESAAAATIRVTHNRPIFPHSCGTAPEAPNRVWPNLENSQLEKKSPSLAESWLQGRVLELRGAARSLAPRAYRISRLSDASFPQNPPDASPNIHFSPQSTETEQLKTSRIITRLHCTERHSRKTPVTRVAPNLRGGSAPPAMMVLQPDAVRRVSPRHNPASNPNS